MCGRAGDRRGVRPWFFHHQVVVGRCTDSEGRTGDRVNRIHESGFTAVDVEGVDDDPDDLGANGIGIGDLLVNSISARRGAEAQFSLHES